MRSAMTKIGFVALVATVLVGCGAKSAYTRPDPGYKVGAAPGELAEVVFMRPSSFAKGIVVTIVDGAGRYIGDSTPKAHFIANVPAGEHTFIAWGEGTHVLRGEFEAGKTYFVEVAPRMGVWSARFHLLAVKPSAESWAKREEWLNSTTPHRVNQEQGQARVVDKRRERAQEAIAKGLAKWAEYNDEEKDQRLLQADDGL